jgi:hypothetical protein
LYFEEESIFSFQLEGLIKHGIRKI